MRIPYRFCSFCNEPLKDYGGKKHLRHVNGMVLSDVWHFEDKLISKNARHSTIIKRLIDLSCTSSTTLLLAPFDGEMPYELKK